MPSFACQTNALILRKTNSVRDRRTVRLALGGSLRASGRLLRASRRRSAGGRRVLHNTDTVRVALDGGLRAVRRRLLANLGNVREERGVLGPEETGGDGGARRGRWRERV